MALRLENGRLVRAASPPSRVYDWPSAQLQRLAANAAAAWPRRLPGRACRLERGEEPAPFPEDAKTSLAVIRSLASGDLDRCLPSHDMDAWRSWRHAPDTYR
ncbi:MAG: hypothetical protein KGJ98_10100 [Chloroflexota bacterium]|nr:hypothetical protein [Chloroflexota bacterium]